jgi:hypothetical protein
MRGPGIDAMTTNFYPNTYLRSHTSKAYKKEMYLLYTLTFTKNGSKTRTITGTYNNYLNYNLTKISARMHTGPDVNIIFNLTAKRRAYLITPNRIKPHQPMAGVALDLDINALSSNNESYLKLS